MLSCSMWNWRGYRIRYQFAGNSGPALLLVHGFGANRWVKVICFLRYKTLSAYMKMFHLEKKFCVILGHPFTITIALQFAHFFTASLYRACVSMCNKRFIKLCFLLKYISREITFHISSFLLVTELSLKCAIFF